MPEPYCIGNTSFSLKNGDAQLLLSAMRALLTSSTELRLFAGDMRILGIRFAGAFLGEDSCIFCGFDLKTIETNTEKAVCQGI